MSSTTNSKSGKGGKIVVSKILGVIGGSGLCNILEMEVISSIIFKTPFGYPSDLLIHGRLNGNDIWFLPRHGRGHLIPPTSVPFRANVWALKSVGVDAVLAFSAVGALADDINPGDLVLLDQIVDRTRHRPESFFSEPGIVAHVSMADPFCMHGFRKLVKDAMVSNGGVLRDGGTVLCMEGPSFSTRAESLLHRMEGFHLVGMNAAQEAKLFREAELPFVTVALATDYDCWHEAEGDVTAGGVAEVMKANAHKAQELIPKVVELLKDGQLEDCPCCHALEGAIMTNPLQIPLAGLLYDGKTPRGLYNFQFRKLAMLVHKYLQLVALR